MGRTTLRSAAGDPGLVARAESATIGAGLDDLAFVRISLEDAAGVVPCDRDVVVSVSVSGPGVLAGLGTGRARTEEPLSAASVTTYDGRALAIVRPTGAGEITVRVTAPGYPEARVLVRAGS